MSKKKGGASYYQSDDPQYDDWKDHTVESFTKTDSKSDKVKSSWGGARCYESHPALEIKSGIVIYGGSCSTPIVMDADVYIGFDSGMKQTWRNDPWEEGVYEVQHRMVDQHPPQDHERFVKLLDWTAYMLGEGKKIHAGCIGGHGRTGTFFAALVKTMTGEPDAITFVRKGYCDKAVESKAQVEYLAEKFGIVKQEPRHYAVVTTKSSGKQYSFPTYGYGKSSPESGNSNRKMASASLSTGKPVRVGGNIWGKMLDRLIKN